LPDNSDLSLYVVGHSDNEGSLPCNTARARSAVLNITPNTRHDLTDDSKDVVHG